MVGASDGDGLGAGRLGEGDGRFEPDGDGVGAGFESGRGACSETGVLPVVSAGVFSARVEGEGGGVGGVDGTSVLSFDAVGCCGGVSVVTSVISPTTTAPVTAPRSQAMTGSRRRFVCLWAWAGDVGAVF
ncbi:hypothetical protein BJF79_10220 [Actinomadura sp. CNU-125]|nr:hypothetical protein BJF79_10220 [Actinomadura sp. CNU-125]